MKKTEVNNVAEIEQADESEGVVPGEIKAEMLVHYYDSFDSIGSSSKLEDFFRKINPKEVTDKEMDLIYMAMGIRVEGGVSNIKSLGSGHSNLGIIVRQKLMDIIGNTASTFDNSTYQQYFFDTRIDKLRILLDILEKYKSDGGEKMVRGRNLMIFEPDRLIGRIKDRLDYLVNVHDKYKEYKGQLDGFVISNPSLEVEYFDEINKFISHGAFGVVDGSQPSSFSPTLKKLTDRITNSNLIRNIYSYS